MQRDPSVTDLEPPAGPRPQNDRLSDSPKTVRQPELPAGFRTRKLTSRTIVALVGPAGLVALGTEHLIQLKASPFFVIQHLCQCRRD